jgi:hypothetical protein
LLGINQVYYRRIFYKTHKHYNYLQLILEQKVFAEVIKNAKLGGLGGGGLMKRWGQGKAQVLKVRLQNCFKKSENVLREQIANICN